jgi:hypothetical protein
MKVYIVTQGSYSDYRIAAVHSTRELAEAHVARLTELTDPNEPAFGEYEVDEPGSIPEVVPEYYATIFLATGELFDGHRPRPDYRWPGAASRKVAACGGGGERVWVNDGSYSQQPARIEVTSRVSQEHARKVAVERRQRWLRENKVVEGVPHLSPAGVKPEDS